MFAKTDSMPARRDVTKGTGTRQTGPVSRRHRPLLKSNHSKAPGAQLNLLPTGEPPGPSASAWTGLSSGPRPPSGQSAGRHSQQFWRWWQTHLSTTYLFYLFVLTGTNWPVMEKLFFLLPFFFFHGNSSFNQRKWQTVFFCCCFFYLFMLKISLIYFLAGVVQNSKFGKVVFGDGLEQNQKQLWNKKKKIWVQAGKRSRWTGRSQTENTNKWCNNYILCFKHPEPERQNVMKLWPSRLQRGSHK